MTQIRLSLPQAALDNVIVLNVRLNERTRVEGLLGMSFLKQCRLVLDGPSRYLEISIRLASRS